MYPFFTSSVYIYSLVSHTLPESHGLANSRELCLGWGVRTLNIVPWEKIRGGQISLTHITKEGEMVTARKLHLLVTLPLIKLVARVLHYELSFVSSLANEIV